LRTVSTDPTANAHASIGKEKLALKLSPDGKTLGILYAFDVAKNGETDPIPLDVHTKSKRYIFAEGRQPLGEPL
jgi:hypothetical protein